MFSFWPAGECDDGALLIRSLASSPCHFQSPSSQAVFNWDFKPNPMISPFLFTRDFRRRDHNETIPCCCRNLGESAPIHQWKAMSDRLRRPKKVLEADCAIHYCCTFAKSKPRNRSYDQSLIRQKWNDVSSYMAGLQYRKEIYAVIIRRRGSDIFSRT